MTTPEQMLEAAKSSGEFYETFSRWFGEQVDEIVFLDLAKEILNKEEQKLIGMAQATLNRRFPYGTYR